MKGQLDRVIEQMSQLYTLCSEAEEFERVQSLVHELQADVDCINKRFAEDEPEVTSESTLSEKSVTSYRDPVRLPQLELPTFEGDPLTWKTFWEEFQCVLDKAPHLNNSDRLRYLKSAVKAKEALSIIDTTSIDGDAYDDVIEQLQRRYDRQRDSYRMHLQQLLHHPLRLNHEDLKGSITHIHKHLKGIRANGPYKAENVFMELNMVEDMFREWYRYTAEVLETPPIDRLRTAVP